MYDKLDRSTCSMCLIGEGVVNTGRPLQVENWGVATPATPAALSPMGKFSSLGRILSTLDVKWTIPIK